MTDIFYFLCFPQGDRTKITVIDLQNCVDYERDEWSNVNKNTYFDHAEAIRAARDIAERYNLEYIPFESRYNRELNENLYLY